MSITSSTSSNFMTITPPLTQANNAGEMANTGNKKTDQKPTTAVPSSSTDASTCTTTIYGTPTAPAPGTSYTTEEREQHIDAYAGRVKALIGNIESDREGKRNIKFQNARQFMEPAGYFSGGLLAAGYDPHEQFNVKFSTYTGMGKPDVLTGTETRAYFAWEIAAGALAHDKVQRGGPINFQSMSIEKKVRGKIKELESLGHKLQDHWEKNIATPMRDTSGVLAQRSGKADAYVIRGTLQSLSNNKDSFEKLSPEAKEAIKRTLEHNGQVIIPNIYGYPLSGYAFIPYTPYDGNYEHRPNQGLMIDLNNGAAHEIKGDDDFANWAKNNRTHLYNSFNARDRQGGKDAHWPKAGDVLDTLIRGKNATYPGYQNFIKDQAIPVRETFNYTRARGEHYQLKFGSLDNSIASKYQEQNATNAVWADQTEVFGSSQQNWKAAKDFWGNTFGYVPVVGNAGNIVFGIHDGIYGKTAEDRVGGSSGAVISALQLAHEIATAGVGGAEEPPIAVLPSDLRDVRWRYNSPSSDFELVREPKTPTDSDSAPIVKEGTTEITRPDEQSVPFPGMREIEFRGKKYFVADEPDAPDKEHFWLRVRHPEDPSKLASAGKIAKPDEAGVWRAPGVKGGSRKWPWQRTPSPTPSDDLKTPYKISDGFNILGNPETSGASKFDEVMKFNNGTSYQQSVGYFEEGGTTKQKLTTSWRVEDNNFAVAQTEAATPNEHGKTPYSPNFLKDLNRDRYTVVIKGKPVDTRVELDATGSGTGETLALRLKQFEKALPDDAMRARVSEVAHQGSIAPASVELRLNQLQEHVGFRGTDQHYTIIYDPVTHTAEVKIEAQIKLLDFNKDATVIPDMDVTMERSLKISESNELDDEGNPYTVDKEAPFTLNVSSISELKDRAPEDWIKP